MKARSPGTLDHADEWEEEIARRIEEVRSGKVKTIPLDQAMAEIRAELDRRR
jgi:putative addiction module component (TIGR02574 family)